MRHDSPTKTLEWIVGLFSKMFGSTETTSSGTVFTLEGAERPLQPNEFGYFTFTWAIEGGETLIRESFISSDAIDRGEPVFQSLIEQPRLAMLYAGVLEAACYHVFARSQLRASDVVMAGVLKGFTDGVESLLIDEKPLPATVQQHVIGTLPQFSQAIEQDLQAAAKRDPEVVTVALSEKVKLLFSLMAKQYADAREYLEGQTVTPENMLTFHRVEATCDSIFESLRDPSKLGVELV